MNAILFVLSSVLSWNVCRWDNDVDRQKLALSVTGIRRYSPKSCGKWNSWTINYVNKLMFKTTGRGLVWYQLFYRLHPDQCAVKSIWNKLSGTVTQRIIREQKVQLSSQNVLNRVTCHSSTLRQKFLKRAESYKTKQYRPDSCSLALIGCWGIRNSWMDNLCPRVRASVVEGGLQWQNQEEEASPLVTDSVYTQDDMTTKVSRASNAA